MSEQAQALTNALSSKVPPERLAEMQTQIARVADTGDPRQVQMLMQSIPGTAKDQAEVREMLIKFLNDGTPPF
jgi:hypothetical protein